MLMAFKLPLHIQIMCPREEWGGQYAFNSELIRTSLLTACHNTTPSQCSSCQCQHVKASEVCFQSTECRRGRRNAKAHKVFMSAEEF